MSKDRDAVDQEAAREAAAEAAKLARAASDRVISKATMNRTGMS